MTKERADTSSAVTELAAPKRRAPRRAVEGAAKPAVRQPAKAKADKRVATSDKGGRQKRGEGRDRILAAALDLFANRGFDAVSTTDIAQQAGSSQSVVLYHFKTKEELWRAAMRDLFASVSIKPGFEGAMYKDLDATSRLRVLLRGFVLASARHPELGRVIHREGASNNERIRWLFEELAKPNYEAFEALFKEGAKQGVLKNYPAAMLTLLAHGAAACLFNLATISHLLLDADPFREELVELQADIVVDVLLNGLAVQPATSVG